MSVRKAGNRLRAFCSLFCAAALRGGAAKDSSGFVALSEAIPDAMLEIRYYSTYNCVGDRMTGHEEPRALFGRGAAAEHRQREKARHRYVRRGLYPVREQF
ncbi:MAG: hypothetical protein IJ702_04000 [Fretibacterium sp.]|nr:hypothetical protein [Fretibacterium sp.]